MPNPYEPGALGDSTTRPRVPVSEVAHAMRDAIADVASAREGHRSASSRRVVFVESRMCSVRVITLACFRGTPGTGRRTGFPWSGSGRFSHGCTSATGRGRPWPDCFACPSERSRAMRTTRTDGGFLPKRPVESSISCWLIGGRGGSSINGKPSPGCDRRAARSSPIPSRAGRRRPISSRRAWRPPAA
jgi:hypothetical protein